MNYEIKSKPMEKWDSRFVDLSRYVSEWSKDPKAKVGAVVVAKRGGAVSIGYNIALIGGDYCYPTAFSLGVKIKNTGSCTTTYSWKVEKEAGNLELNLQGNSGTVTLKPGGKPFSGSVGVSFAANGPQEGTAKFKLTVTSRRMSDVSTSATVTATPSQSLVVVGRSHINSKALYSKWDDFPADFQYPDISGGVLTFEYGTHNPAAYGFFILGAYKLGDVGGTPSKNGKYRMWSRITLKGCCTDGKIKRLYVASKDSDAGFEPGGFQGTGLFGPIVLERINDSRFKFSYDFYGHPSLGIPADDPLIGPEVGMQQVRSRTSNDIWHLITGEITCDSGNALKATLKLYGSDFPTHEVFVNKVLVDTHLQTAISDLWKPLPGQPERVNGVLP